MTAVFPSTVLKIARAQLAVPGAWAGDGAIGKLTMGRALARACTDDEAVLEASRLLIKAVKERGGQGSYTLWEMKPGRTIVEVLAVYDRAIALAESPP